MTLAAGAAALLVGPSVSALAFGASGSDRPSLPLGWWRGGGAGGWRIAGVTAIACVVAVVAVSSTSSPALAIAAWVFSIVGVGLIVIDVRLMRLPFELSAALYAATAIAFIFNDLHGDKSGSVGRAALVAFTTAFVLLTIALLAPGQLGLGDVVFAGATSGFLGYYSWGAALSGLTIGFGANLLIVAFNAVARTASRKTPLPLGPALLAGWIIVLAGVGR